MIIIIEKETRTPEAIYATYCEEAIRGEVTYRITKETEKHIISYMDFLLRKGLRYCEIYRYLTRTFGNSLISEIGRKRIYAICDMIMRDVNTEEISLIKEVI